MDVPISSYTINLILQYISPPSQLINPIPSNLLSHSLQQRHILLDISPDQPTSYLSWPSLGRDRAIQHLESLQMPLNELVPDFLVGYTVDPEHAYAHVHVKPTGEDGLRLVFEWDGQDSWKYHDSNVMPFPPGTHPSLTDAVAAATMSTPESSGENRDKSEHDDDDSDDNDYWNSYGTEDKGMQFPPPTSKGESDASEDAYWAQYASVQGTADSTIPSPVHKTARKLQSVSVAHHVSREEIICTAIRSHPHDPKAPPSPTTLRHRLTALSPRHIISPPSDDFFEPGAEEDIPEATEDDSESPSSFLDHEPPFPKKALQTSQERIALSAVTTEATDSFAHQQDADSRVIQEYVRALFQQWKTMKQRSSQTSTDEIDRFEFLQLVDRAITTPK